MKSEDSHFDPILKVNNLRDTNGLDIPVGRIPLDKALELEDEIYQKFIKSQERPREKTILDEYLERIEELEGTLLDMLECSPIGDDSCFFCGGTFDHHTYVHTDDCEWANGWKVLNKSNGE